MNKPQLSVILCPPFPASCVTSTTLTKFPFGKSVFPCYLIYGRKLTLPRWLPALSGLFSFGHKSILHPLSSLLRDPETDKWPSGGGDINWVSWRTEESPPVLNSHLSLRIVMCILPESFTEEFWNLSRPLWFSCCFVRGEKHANILKTLCYLSFYLQNVLHN